MPLIINGALDDISRASVQREAVDLTVVITAYNRQRLLERAVASTVDQSTRARFEVIVVDDASDPPIAVDSSTTRLIRMARNGGVGNARAAGMAAARSNWVVLLDDDDYFLPGALRVIASVIAEPQWTEYPMLQFSYVETRQEGDDFVDVERLEDLCGRTRVRDYVQVINKALFRGLGHAEDRHFPAEFLYVWDLASRYGIPTFREPVARVGHDAPARLTGAHYLLAKAAEHADALSVAAERFGAEINTHSPWFYRRLALRALLYHTLAGERRKARRTVRRSLLPLPYKLAGLAFATLTPQRQLALSIGWLKNRQALSRQYG